MDGWRLDVVHMLGEDGGARHNLRHVAGITQAAKETQPEAYIVGEHFGDARQWLQADVEDAAMNYRGFTFPLWGFSRTRIFLTIRNRLTRRPVWRGWRITARGSRTSSSCGCSTSSTATIRRGLNRCLEKTSRVCRWRLSGCLAGRASPAFTTAMRWDWMATTTRSAANPSPAGGEAGCRAAGAVPASGEAAPAQPGAALWRLSGDICARQCGGVFTRL